MANKPRRKVISSPNYNLVFDMETGNMMRWGKTPDDDPTMCPWGPEIADVEISTVCNGIGRSMETRQPCSWCYKSNTGTGENMSLETFKNVFAHLNAANTLTQIAFGIGDIDSNPDLWDIMAYCRKNNVIPNITVNGMGIDSYVAAKLASTCGAVAVSHYGPAHENNCFNTVESLAEAGLKQVNIHKLLSKQTISGCYDLIDKVRTAKDSKHGPFALDRRLAGLKAIVFLLLKPKGDRNSLDSIVSMEDYQKLMDYAQASGVAVGMDSCSAPMALKTLPASVIPSVEPCESTLFSIYVNTQGEMFPCSFTEGTPGWETGIDLTGPVPSDDRCKVQTAMAMWYHPRVLVWRAALQKSSSGCSGCGTQQYCRSCPVYDITICQPKPELRKNESLIQIKRKESQA